LPGQAGGSIGAVQRKRGILCARRRDTARRCDEPMPADSVPLISHAIQLAIAPVFLLTGIAGLLGVMATRLARVIDRARMFEQAWSALDEPARQAARREIASLETRRRLASWSINFCTAAALLVCLVIVTLFIEEFFGRNLRWLAGSLFVLAMVAVIGGLASFLREVYLATHATSIDPSRFGIDAN
jgi:hypothetical protein